MAIPRIDYSDDSLDSAIKNLTPQGRNLFHNVVSIEAHNIVESSPYNAIKDENHLGFTLTFSHIQVCYSFVYVSSYWILSY